MRVFNFSAGPAVLPEEVLRQAAAEMLDWHGSEMSVMEMSHRGKEFIAIAEEAEADLRALLAIPANYKVLFLQGGASLQFAMVPMNLLRGKGSADYVNTGEWSKKAIKEAQNFCKVNVAASAEDGNFSYVHERARWNLDPNAAYVHVCTNETIGGVEFHWVPDVTAAAGEAPAVVDTGLTRDGVTVLRLPGLHPRFELLAPPARMQELWKSIAAAARPVGAHVWAWLDIAAGIPTVLPETVEEFVPQMANLELVGGVSFKKGCYPGQEIVARMHYLGTLKERMVRAHLPDTSCPSPGTKLYASAFGEQSAGTVVDAQPSPHGGCDLLAVAQLTAVQGGGLRVAALKGPVLELSPLPYSLGAAS